MKHFNTFVFSIIAIVMAALAASCGASSVGAGPADLDNPGGVSTGPAADEQLALEQLPAFPLADDAAEASGASKGVSWLSHPNHLAPAASHLGAIDPGDPTCFLLKGLKAGIPGVTNRPQIAYAIYKIPLGALEPDLLEMKVAAQIGAPGENYFAAIANFTGMHWQFYGPLNTPSWQTDMTTLGYDFTSPAGDLYVALIALPGMSLHITDITLNFKDREKPNGTTIWNVYGQAFDDYATGTPHAGYLVSFENLGTGVVYTALTAVDGRWGMNLPGGHYKFGIDANEMLLDVSGPVALIDYIYDASGFGIKLDLDNTGHIVYVDDNAAYFGAVVPMPLITANNY